MTVEELIDTLKTISENSPILEQAEVVIEIEKEYNGYPVESIMVGIKEVYFNNMKQIRILSRRIYKKANAYSK